ncbi:phosphotransferase family protein [Salinirubrum litoreum]|uniref:Phosphotransferase family protein n=1 Tax=Salinirubrum litoreum TaxID=1126234 RepID=A0ABD5RFI4_9EURY|nr:phosphotransferase [Salinirubrum litoreum]
MTAGEWESVVSACCARHADDVRVTRLLHAVPPHCVADVEFAGRRAVCKVSLAERGRAGVEGRVLRYVDRETSVPVPAVLATDDAGFVADYREDAPTSDRSAAGSPGDTDSSAGDTDSHVTTEWLSAAGRTLATLHDEATFDRSGTLAVESESSSAESERDSLTVGECGLRIESLPGVKTSDARWPAALDAQLAVYEDSLAGTGYADVARDARRFVTTHADRVALPADWRPSLCHGWFSPDHVAVRDGSVACVVDFEHALVGSPEWDYWRTVVPLVSGRGWSVPAGGRETFRASYESVRSLPPGTDEREPAYRALLAVSYLDSLHAQQGIDAETRDRAEFFRERATEGFDRLSVQWSE